MSRSLVVKAGSLDSLNRCTRFRLQPMRPPDSLHRADADADSLGHRRRGPVRRLAGWIALGERDDALDQRGRQRRFTGRARLIAQEPVDAFEHEALLPAPHTGFVLACLALDPARPDTGAGQQDDPGPPNMLLRTIAVSHNRLETSTIGGINGESDSCAHPADSHTQRAAGIPSRSLSLDLIH